MTTREISDSGTEKEGTGPNAELNDEQLEGVAGGGVASFVHDVMDRIKDKAMPVVVYATSDGSTWKADYGGE